MIVVSSVMTLIKPFKMSKTELKLGDIATYADFTVTAKLDHNNEPILMIETKEGQMIVRLSPSIHTVNLYSALLCNTVCAYTESGDFVRCDNCDKLLLLPAGTEVCPACKAVDMFSWIDDSKRQYDYDAILKLKCSIKSCREIVHE